MARATCLKLVIRQVTSPTSDARRCCFTACFRPRRANRKAVIRLRASCFLTWLSVISSFSYAESAKATTTQAHPRNRPEEYAQDLGVLTVIMRRG